MLARALCLGLALLGLLLAASAWMRTLPQLRPLEPSQQAPQRSRSATRQPAAEPLEDLKATVSSTFDLNYFGTHHLFDGSPSSC